MRFSVALALSTAATLAPRAVVEATQDSAYYPGFRNPNVIWNKLYYREAINVLQDIDAGKFSALFIEYHGCVWSEFGSSGEEGVCADGGAKLYQINDNQNDRYYSSSYKQPWYQGHTQCFRANAAYSLYGIPAGQSSQEGCTEKHYINSFFTDYGIESFGEPLGIDYETPGATSTCASKRVRNDGQNQNQQGGNNNDNMNGNNGNNNDNYAYNQYHNEITLNDYVSYTTGCSKSSNGFVKAMFRGAYCDGSNYLSTNNMMDDFNTGLESMGCTQVYSDDATASSYYIANNIKNAGNVYNAQYNGETSMAFQLLAYSRACSVVEYPDSCPDPHGIKQIRDMRLYQKGQANLRPVPIIMPITSVVLAFCAVVLFGASCFVRARAASVQAAHKQSIKDRKLAEYAKEEYPNNLGATLRLFARSTSNFSTATISVIERLRAYAEEEVDDDSRSDSEQSAAIRNPVWGSDDDDHLSANIQLPPSMDNGEKQRNALEPLTDVTISAPKSSFLMSASASTQGSAKLSDPSGAMATRNSNNVSFDDSPVFVDRPVVSASGSMSVPPADGGGILVGQVDVLADQTQTIASVSRSQSVADPSVAPSNSGSALSKSNGSRIVVQSGDDGSDGSAVIVENVSKDSEEAHAQEVADALVAERSIIPPPSAEGSTNLDSKKFTKKKVYKRPALAKISKFLFRKKNKSPPVKEVTTGSYA